MEEIITQIAFIIGVGIVAQWIAWRWRIPSILLLLFTGFIVGPILGLLHPDALLGNSLSHLVSLAVGIILFEGGMTLKFEELRSIRPTVRNLNTISVVITWAIVTIAAFAILKLSLPLALLLGAILTVTGPTVIGPLLRHVGNVGQAGTILKWEGILIDPIGATLALLVFEAIVSGSTVTAAGNTITSGILGFMKTAIVGTGVGVVGVWIIIFCLRRYLIPDFLRNPFVLMLVIVAFAIANMLQHESGILATTVMGLILTNKKDVDTHDILEFKETLSILLVSVLFIVLSARLNISVLGEFNLNIVLFLAILLFIARPVSVAVATWGSDLNWRERLFIAWLAPRGIVAAAVTSLFALQLVEEGYAEAERLVPIVFFVIVGTVLVYGLSASPLSKWLKLVKEYPTGFLIAGAQPWARHIAHFIEDHGQKVILVDSNPDTVGQAIAEGLRALQGNILAEQIEESVEFEGVEQFLALTANDEINSLAALNYSQIFQRGNVYQLAPHRGVHREGEPSVPRNLRGTTLFDRNMTVARITELFDGGAELQAIKLNQELPAATFKEQYPDVDVLFVLYPNGRITPVKAGETPTLADGQTVIILGQGISHAREMPIEATVGISQ